MYLKKITASLLTINVLQFFIGLGIWIALGRSVSREVNIFIYLAIGLMLFSSLITIFGLYSASRYKNDNLKESIKSLEELNTRLREQRHDYLNHFQVIYGLLELKEYEEVKKYIDPVFKDIMKVSKALKTAQPAVNALLQAKIEAAEKNQIDLYLEIRSDLKNITLEAWNLCKVLANIIDNSITALAGKEEEKTINIDIGEDLNNYMFQISNNGPEIPKNLQEDIFKQGVTTKEGDGHGLGLFIASKIVQEAGGTIYLTSNTGKTSFYVEIPKVKGNPN
jgi:two-component system, LytTR family, sensor histidine kinase AgrC